MIAVYGTLREGHGNHGLIDGKKKWEGRIDGWVMHSLGGFPTCIPGDGTITVEVWDVTPSSARRVDALEGYPDFYDKVVVNTPVGDAEMYTCPLSRMASCGLIESGDWNDARRNW